MGKGSYRGRVSVVEGERSDISWIVHLFWPGIKRFVHFTLFFL